MRPAVAFSHQCTPPLRCAHRGEVIHFQLRPFVQWRDGLHPLSSDLQPQHGMGQVHLFQSGMQAWQIKAIAIKFDVKMG